MTTGLWGAVTLLRGEMKVKTRGASGQPDTQPAIIFTLGKLVGLSPWQHAAYVRGINVCVFVSVTERDIERERNTGSS